MGRRRRRAAVRRRRVAGVARRLRVRAALRPAATRFGLLRRVTRRFVVVRRRLAGLRFTEARRLRVRAAFLPAATRFGLFRLVAVFRCVVDFFLDPARLRRIFASFFLRAAAAAP